MNRSFVIMVSLIFFVTCTIWAMTLHKVRDIDMEKRRQLAHEIFAEDEGRMEDFFESRSAEEVKKLFKIGFMYCDLIALETQNIKDTERAFEHIKQRVEAEIVNNLKAY